MGRRKHAAPPKRTQPQGRGKATCQQRKPKGEYTGEDFNDLVEQVKPLGLFVRRMEADGNCLFRAFADQLNGDCEEHMQYREECCEYMLANAEELQLFHADEDFEECESFEDYVEHMRSPGRWGSQLELMALCRRYEVNAIVHQSGLPAYEMIVAPLESRCLQLSYHDGEHFNSIRLAGDVEPGVPARCLSLSQVRGQRPDGGDDGEGLGELSGAEPDEGSPRDGSADEEREAEASSARPASAATPAGTGAGKGPKPSRAEKRTERKKAKEAKEAVDRRRKADTVAEAAASDATSPETLALLTKHLIAV